MFRSNNTKITTLFVVTVFATALVTGPTFLTADNVFAKQKYKNWNDCREDHSSNWCKKYFKKHDNNNNNGGGGNKASQGIGQSQSSSQNSQCVSGGSTSGSCNNISVQNQQNSGNNALAQNGNGGSNKASQGIGQSQSSSQNSQVVSGGNTFGSGNNVNVQNQVNTGNNALAQQ